MRRLTPFFTLPILALGAGPSPDPAAFQKSIQPVLSKSCVMCHNDRNASGGLNLAGFATPASVHAQREGWEKIMQKMRTGEMPPKGLPRPDAAQVKDFLQYLQGEYEKADRNVKPDPGRVTARRLNRNEYSNTIRDLLGVDFHANRDFPSDDSGYGFDNIGDVLTISPVLMEKYITAAEKIAARALGNDPLPKKPLEFEYHSKEKKIRRPNTSNIEAVHRVDWDGEYDIRIGMPGERSADAKPVMLGFWMDGKLLHSMEVETKPSGLVYFNPYSDAHMRLFLPEGEHTFRAGFINDDFVKNLTDKEAYSNKSNKFLDMISFVGPYPVKTERASRKKLLVCDPKTGQACMERIISTVARRAYRRPVTKLEVASLMKFVELGKKEKFDTDHQIQLALQAMLVSPHFLFRVEHDPDPNDPTKVHRISDLELASRLSYFLWSSIPDNELLSLAETNKLHITATMDAQIKRMMGDERSAAFAANFAGQWLETRNLDQVKPDPKKFPEWGPDLRDAMKTETRMFFEAMFRENRPMSDFLDARFTFLNDRLAKHYGIPGVVGPEFRRVELTTDQRGGLLAQGSILTVSSYPTRTSPVIRGKYILQNILGAPPPAPPPDVPLLDEEAVGSSGSLRQQMEQHRSNAMCASCHAKMDAIGFALENYDAIGKWRTEDGKFKIDAAGTFPNGKSFANPAEMRVALKDETDAFVHCLAEKMLTYALGRGLERYDKKTLEEIERKVAASGNRFQPLVYEIVHSLPFLQRRGEISKIEKERPKETARR